MSEQTAVADGTRERRAAGEADYLIQAKNDDESWVDLGHLKVPGGTRRAPSANTKSSVLELAVQKWPDEFPQGEQAILRAIRMYQAEKDLAEHQIGVEVAPRVVVG